MSEVQGHMVICGHMHIHFIKEQGALGYMAAGCSARALQGVRILLRSLHRHSLCVP